MTTAIKIENLSKKYIIGHHRQDQFTTFREVLMHKLRSAGQYIRHPLSLNQETIEQEELWALRDINLVIEQGERVGIIGQNGAGKSTLLKVLSRITEPTVGRIRMNGRVASLLEVGTGFHPELSGRENIFLNGAILGMSKVEIKSKFDEIVAFAETEKFLDTPVKRYSSGMYVRLAFAVAAHLEPEILIVDEVLAVGDAGFQKKCLSKMDISAKEGKTVLFVSHNMTAIQRLCECAIWLEGGQIRQLGAATEVVSAYISAQYKSGAEKVWSNPIDSPGNAVARLEAVRITDAEGITVSQLDISDSFFVEVDYHVDTAGVILNSSISLFNEVDVYVLASPSVSDTDWFQKPHPTGKYRSRCKVPSDLLNQGRFSVTVLLVKNGTEIIAQADRVIGVALEDKGKSREGYLGFWGGVVRPKLEWTTIRM